MTQTNFERKMDTEKKNDVGCNHEDNNYPAFITLNLNSL